MEALIRAAGRVPYQRTTLYGEAPAERVEASFRAAPLAQPVNRAAAPRRRGSREQALVRFG